MLRNMLFLAVGAALLFVFFGGSSSGSAQNCMGERQRYGMKDFYNSCNYPIVIKVCSKFGVNELREAFGGRKSEWRCQQAVTRPGNVGPSISWAQQNSSLLAGAMSNTRFIAAACKTGYGVNIDVNTGKFTCIKR